MLGNRALLLMAKCLVWVVNTSFLFPDARQGSLHMYGDIRLWNENAGNVIRPLQITASKTWYPTAAGAAAKQMALATELKAWTHWARIKRGAEEEDGIEQCATEIVKILKCFPSDAAQVQAVHPPTQAALEYPEVRDNVVEILETVETKTGFSTEAKVAQLRNMRPRFSMERTRIRALT
jgi:hypothetical protein